MRILDIDKTSVTACPDTGLPVSFIERGTLSKHFPYQPIQNLENGLNESFQGLGGMALAVNTFVDLPVCCKTMKNSYMYFPPVRAYVVDSTPENVVLLGLNFLISNALDLRWARKGGFATHRLQIGDTDNYIRLWTETKIEPNNFTLVPVFRQVLGSSGKDESHETPSMQFSWMSLSLPCRLCWQLSFFASSSLLSWNLGEGDYRSIGICCLSICFLEAGLACIALLQVCACRTIGEKDD